MRKALQSGLTLFALLVACALAAGQTVSYKSTPGIDFSRYHTYKWVPIEGGSHPNPGVDAQIRQIIDAQLAAKGLTKTEADSASLYIGYQAAVSEQKMWNGYGAMGRAMDGAAMAGSSTITVGTLDLDMYDPATRQLVWSGTVAKALTPGTSQPKKEKNLAKAVEKLLKKYPPAQ